MQPLLCHHLMVKPAENQEGYSARSIEMAPPTPDSSEHSDCECNNCPVGCAALIADMQAWRMDVARYGDSSGPSFSSPRVPLAVRCRCLECRGFMMHVCKRVYPGYGRSALGRLDHARLETPCSHPHAPMASRLSLTGMLSLGTMRQPPADPPVLPDE